MIESPIKLTPSGLALYNGWHEGNHLRIWVGIHPTELDAQRILAQHSEVHMMLSIIRQAREQNKPANEVAEPWNNGRGIAALYYFHTLLITQAFPRFGFAHETELMKMPSSWSVEVTKGYEEIADLFKDCDHTNGVGVPAKWPPSWISPQEKIADLMDLQLRWAKESKHVELSRSIERYGKYEGGKPSGERTDPSSIATDVIQRYHDHREARRLVLAARAATPPVEPPAEDEMTRIKRSLGVDS